MSQTPAPLPDPPYLRGLNAPQREAVLTTEGPVLVLAGAGTGKTAALTARLAHLIATRRAWPSEILAVTFTNKAAREMKERVGRHIGEAVEGMPWLGTFHAIGAKMLRRHAELVGLKSNFTILDTDDQLRLLKQIILAADIDEKRWPARLLAGMIDRWKNKGWTPDQVDAGEAEGYANGKGAQLYKLYQARLRDLNACDFGDLLLHMLVILKTHRDVLELYQQRFRYILVDEYQDTNQSQYLWLRLLAQERKNICCVGDDDQCLAEGTPVTMADGSLKPIEAVTTDDLVLSCHGSGDFRPARVARVARRECRSALVRLRTAGGRQLIGTTEHTHFADFIRAESPQKYFTYLMWKRDVGYRLGTSQIYTRGQLKPVIGFKQRCLQERADAVWLIDAFDNENDAREREHCLSLAYGITTLPFVARKGGSTNGLVHDQARLDRLHRGLDSEAKALRLMQDHGLSLEHPHHVPQTAAGRRAALNLTLYAEHRGATPMHRISLSGNDPEGREAVTALGLNPRPYKRNPANWRYETLYRDVAKLDSVRKLLATRFDLQLKAKANLLGKPLALRPAAQVRPGMMVACADGTHDVVTAVETVAGGGAVYDIDVEGTHNFVAGGIVTHNSIYSWRGAEVSNILKFEKDFPGAVIIRLEQNYRSTPHILGAASGLIAQNATRLGKTLWTEADEGEKVQVIGVWDGPEEARRVGDELESLQRRGGRLDQAAILVRAQFQTREFEDRFIAIGLPYRIVGGFRFYERAEIRDALAYLRVIAQPADDLAFERIVNVPKRGLGDKAVAKLHSLARAEGIPLSLAAAQILDTDELTGAARRSLGNLVTDFARWRARLDDLPHPELARLVLDESGYTAMLQADRSAESAGRLENLAELARAMEEYENLGAFLEHVSLVMDNDADPQADKVTIMTIHAAKGLEFDTVFLAGWEEGVFPSQRALDEGGNASLEEERRLAYVAITRARRKCFILHAANRRIYGQWTSSIPSRFVAELPEPHLDQETTMTGGASLWRANWSERADPFASVALTDRGLSRAQSRGPGWQRAAASGRFDPNASRVLEAKASAVSFGNPGRTDIRVGQRVFHSKFGYGEVAEIEGNKLEIDFEHSGRKRVLDSFVSVA
ncbi:UvrD-helicase domain-containing protein [Sphingosinicella sp. LHD-64]|uniref:UvrD-helicase domain-containing protein n=1 Tax=Sphingosinicella sp. LHD-64 TaxID=3072139 RepID=UPI00280F5523|nr:UvrD-helicase domain-containing protein [Sphingosinicella sp. LHD-64]MDQ8755098.1 UvrD-helicase domain-containing protein [Sphingosinicella sp. LHD-64]